LRSRHLYLHSRKVRLRSAGEVTGLADRRHARTDGERSPGRTIPRGPIGDGQEVRVHDRGQEWTITWHTPDFAPDGRRHGSAGICLTPDELIVLVSADGTHWDWPAGRPEDGEDWDATLRRELREEACADVLACRLLGFSRGHCIGGQEKGLVLVRAIWQANIELRPWEPQFETRYRRLVPVTDVVSHVTVSEGYLPIYRRALLEAGLY